MNLRRVRWIWLVLCAGLMLCAGLSGCAALADPPEEGPVRRSARAATDLPLVEWVVLPVKNATRRALALPPDHTLGLFEPVAESTEGESFTVPDLIQAGVILALHDGGRHPAGMGWINERIRESPESVEAAWRVAADERLPGTVVWIIVTEWNDQAWRQRSIIRVSAEVVWFEPGRTETLRTALFQRHPFMIPPLSTLAQAAGHVGMKMAAQILVK
jgi:hypothetical protein